MAETQKYRDYIQRRVEEVKQIKEDAKEVTGCQHEWETFRQSVPIDNLRFKGSDAYFVVKGCPKCKTKRLLDYSMS